MAYRAVKAVKEPNTCKYYEWLRWATYSALLFIVGLIVYIAEGTILGLISESIFNLFAILLLSTYVPLELTILVLIAEIMDNLGCI